MPSREVRALVAAVQALVGIAWLASGVSVLKLNSLFEPLGAASGAGGVWAHQFTPAGMLALPELLLGVVLVSAALVLLGRPRLPWEPHHRLTLVELAGASGAAIVSAVLCAAGHIWLGGSFSMLASGQIMHVHMVPDPLVIPLSILVGVIDLRLLLWVRGADSRSWALRRMRELDAALGTRRADS